MRDRLKPRRRGGDQGGEAGRAHLEEASRYTSEGMANVSHEPRAAQRIVRFTEVLPEPWIGEVKRVDVGRVGADDRKVRQLLFNMLTDAVTFTPEGSRLTIAARREHGRVDIAPGDLGRVFDAFGQARNQAGPSEGTGLGLAPVRRYLEDPGRAVSVESVVGNGSTFAVKLPVRQASRDQ